MNNWTYSLKIEQNCCEIYRFLCKTSWIWWKYQLNIDFNWEFLLFWWLRQGKCCTHMYFSIIYLSLSIIPLSSMVLSLCRLNPSHTQEHKVRVLRNPWKLKKLLSFELNKFSLLNNWRYLLKIEQNCCEIYRFLCKTNWMRMKISTESWI